MTDMDKVTKATGRDFKILDNDLLSNCVFYSCTFIIPESADVRITRSIIKFNSVTVKEDKL